MDSVWINREIQLMGLSPKHQGFFLISKLVASMEGVPDEKLLETYSTVCAGFEKGRRMSDRCMCYAINYAWEIEKGHIHDLFPDRGTEPTPKEFAIAVHWELEKHRGRAR